MCDLNSFTLLLELWVCLWWSLFLFILVFLGFVALWYCLCIGIPLCLMDHWENRGWIILYYIFVFAVNFEVYFYYICSYMTSFDCLCIDYDIRIDQGLFFHVDAGWESKTMRIFFVQMDSNFKCRSKSQCLSKCWIRNLRRSNFLSLALNHMLKLCCNR